MISYYHFSAPTRLTPQLRTFTTAHARFKICIGRPCSPQCQAVATGAQEGWKDVVNGNGAEDILQVKHLRHKLQPRQSPFAVDNLGGCGFVGDLDLISLQAARFEGESSSGAGCASGIVAEDGSCLVDFPAWGRRAGPRQTVYFEPTEVTAAIVTCGGLCPGLNDVVQNIVCKLLEYGVPDDKIYGIMYGLRGFYSRHIKPIHLDREAVEDIHLKGGTILGTSRGGADVHKIVQVLERWDIKMLFVVGGNGGNAAAQAIQDECERRNVIATIVGVPKSIDNDILLLCTTQIDRCFGHDTAVEESARCLLAAKVEAKSALRGLAIVRIMGRSSGYLAMNAAMASGVVDVCLIPEIRWELENLIEHTESIIARKGHAILCVAEGTGQHLFEGDDSTDASGNAILRDIGTYLRDAFKCAKPEYDIKYFDPTYLVRALPTNANDRILCQVLGQASVHGAFAGYTGFTTGSLGMHFVMFPIDSVVQAVRTVDPRGRAWSRLTSSIRQPKLYTESEKVDSSAVPIEACVA